MMRIAVLAVTVGALFALAILKYFWSRDEKVGQKREQDRRRQIQAEQKTRQAHDRAPLTRLARGEPISSRPD